jgi:TonB-dependent receptor-like protein
LAASYNGQAVWGEDEINLGRRLTVKIGARFDRMEGISQDVQAVDGQFNETGQTIAGLGHMFTWTQVSPRAGVNIKLTNDDKTVLRATVGRYYRPIVLNDFTNVYPGVAVSTLARYNPATKAYDQIVSVTDPKANIAIDSNMDAPYTDQYSVGVDRELVSNLALSVSYVRKNSKNQIGWIDIGGVYGTGTATVSVFGQNQTLPVYPLLNSPSARKFLRTNGPGFFTRYDGLILNLTRRYANRWMATVGYTYSKTNGLQPTGNLGRDPNDLTNLTGRIDPQDRPHTFNLFGSYEVPRIEVQVSGQLAAVNGTPYAPQVLVNLPQGRRSINVDVPGSYRTPTETFLQFRVSKILFRTDHRRVELTGEVRNALQETDSRSIITRNVASPDFGKPAAWPDPRQLQLLAKVFF